MAVAMKALPGVRTASVTHKPIVKATPAFRRLPIRRRIVSVAVAAPDAPSAKKLSKDDVMAQIAEYNAKLKEAGVPDEFAEVYDDEEDYFADEPSASDDYEGPDVLVLNDPNAPKKVIYDINGDLIPEGPQADEILQREFPGWFEANNETYEQSEADDMDDGADDMMDDTDLDEDELKARDELETAGVQRDEAIHMLRSWTPEMLEELYPDGKVPGFNKKQSKDLWRALRYFLAVEAVDAAYEVQNLVGKDGELVEFDDDDDFDEEDMDEDTEQDLALAEEYDDMVRKLDISFKPRDKVYGTVYKVTEDGAYVELGGKASGYVPLVECSSARLSSPTEVLKVGSKREFVVLELDDHYGEVILSLRAMEMDVLWQRIKQLQEEDVTVYATVDAITRGGLQVTYEGINGFIPSAQFGSKLQLESNMEVFLGVQVPVKIFDAIVDESRIIFSNKRATAAEGGLSSTGLAPGDVLAGVVQTVKPYGAFIDLGGYTGLLHISQISHERVVNVEKIFSEGDKLKVMVLSMDRDRGRVTLSTKKLEPTPGDMIRAPDLVYEKADEMGEMFKRRMKEAQQFSEGLSAGQYGNNDNQGYFAGNAEQQPAAAAEAAPATDAPAA